MMKKLGTILLALVLIVTLAACGAGQQPAPPQTDPKADAFETYTRIMQQMNIVPGQDGAYDIDFTMILDMEFMGEVIQAITTGSIQAIVEGDIMRSFMVMEMDMGALGSTVMEMYMEMEGTSFTEIRMTVDGMEIPSELIMPEMLEGMFEDAINMPDVSEEAFQSVEIEEVDGNTVMHIVLDGALLMDFAMDTAADMLADMGMEMDITIEGDVPMTITVDANGNPISMTMEMHMTMVVEGEEMTMGMISEFFFVAFGDDVVLGCCA